MHGFLSKLFATTNRATKRRWEREKKARELGLFGASPSRVVEGVVAIGVQGIDGMRSENLGAPDSDYYEDQSVDQFDKAYAKIQRKTESLIASDAR